MNIVDEVDERYNYIAILACYIFIHNPNDLLISSILEVKHSKEFLKNVIEKLKELWAQRALLKGLPNISYKKTRLDLLSAIHISSFVELTAQLAPLKTQAICELPCLYAFKYNLDLASKIFKSCVCESKHQRGIIFIMDMTKSSDFIIKTGDNPDRLSNRLSELEGILIDFGSRIVINNKNSRFWITEGDKFISFIEILDRESDIFNALILIYKELKEIKETTGIGFKAGAHWGWLLFAGDFIYSNTDIIIATRAMEFSKRDDVIIVTDTLRQEILKRKNGVEESLKVPRILLEGKPFLEIRPMEVSMSVSEKNIKLFEIGE